MTKTFRPIEQRQPDIPGPVLPFDHQGEEYFVARGEDGVLYHSPICADFVRYGWCQHLNNARARAEHPRVAWASEVHSMAVFGVEEGRSLRAIASDIVTLAFEQESRERALEEWNRRQARTPAEMAQHGRDALRRYSQTAEPAA